jgi:hypothetical protein
MNERLIIRLTQDGKQVSFSSISSDGVIINNEEDTWPSGLGLQFDGANEITRYRMGRVRTINGWETRTYKLDAHIEGGRLVFTGVTAMGLPAGSYWFRLFISDLKLPSKQFSFKLDEDGQAEVDVEVEKDTRRVELSGDVADFDSQIARVLTDDASRLDGMSARDWLLSPTRRQRRKACMLNVLAKLRSIPTASDPLIASVRYIFFAEVDRIYAAVGKSFYERLTVLVKDPKKPFYYEGSPKSAGHRRLLKRAAKFDGEAEKSLLYSFRQEGKNSLQAVVAVPPTGSASDRYYADIDLDLGNPLQDLQGFFIHMGELIDPGKTDHFGLYSKLSEDKKVSPYLAYKLVKA